ncbi:MAG: tol-pal system YbgF family protein, partial [Acutalibacteraceae bacterium]
VEADGLLTAGEYDAAKEEFLSVGGFSDAEEKAKECDYRKAQSMLDAADFDGAKELFSSISGYSDAEEKVKECDYKKAAALMEAGSLDEAKELFSAVASYSDAANMRSECDYRKAVNLKNAGSYTEAVGIFETIIGYSDSAELCREAMYLYSTANGNYTHDNITSLTYLKKLSDEGYKDSAELYSRLSQWYVSLIYNEGAEDYETEGLSIPIDRNHYFHIKASGGGPNEAVTFKWTVEINNKSFEGLLENITDGGTATFGWAAGDPAYTGGAGDMTVKIYNNATGELLAAKLFYVSSR